MQSRMASPAILLAIGLSLMGVTLAAAVGLAEHPNQNASPEESIGGEWLTTRHV